MTRADTYGGNSDECRWFSRERELAVEHLVEYHSQRPYVHASSVSLSLEELGGHVLLVGIWRVTQTDVESTTDSTIAAPPETSDFL